MNIIDEIRTRLNKYPDVKSEIGADYVRVAPNSEDGFSVELDANHNEYTVHFNGWHETLAEQEEALNCFAFGLSTDCRLREYSRSGLAYIWTVKYKDGDKWLEDGTISLLIYPHWGKKEIVVLQNKPISGGNGVV